MSVKLGSKVRDVVTGFEGVATGRAEYLTGCVQICVSPPVDGEGKLRDANWFDEDRLQMQDAPAVKIAITNAGGPQAFPPPAR